MDERKQFTFYKSWYDSLKKIKNKNERLRIYDAICELALFGNDTEFDGWTGAVFDSIRPVVLQGLEKSRSGKIGGEANRKQTESKSEANEKLYKGKGKGKDKEQYVKENTKRKISNYMATSTTEDIENMKKLISEMEGTESA